MPRVLISYAQGDPAHSKWVAELAARLGTNGLEVIIDQYEPRPSKPWQDWINGEFKRATWILLACTPSYCEYFKGGGAGDVGRGVRWEANLIQQELSASKLENRRFIPILPTGSGETDIPLPLRGFLHFDPDEQYAALLAILRRPPDTGDCGEPSPKPAKHIPNPYPGLSAFTERQADAFFGRDEDIRRVADRLIEQRYVCVVGRSGTGKSSLLAAGVLPALRKALPRLSYLRFTPEDDPFARLADALDRLMPEERLRSREAPRVERLAGELRADPGTALGRHPASTCAATGLCRPVRRAVHPDARRQPAGLQGGLGCAAWRRGRLSGAHAAK